MFKQCKFRMNVNSLSPFTIVCLKFMDNHPFFDTRNVAVNESSKIAHIIGDRDGEAE